MAKSDECHFWRLPLEIRFEIYSLVWGHGGEVIKPRWLYVPMQLVFFGRGKQKAVPVAGAENRAKRGVITKRIVSKQFLAETIQHHVEKNTFTFWRLRGGFGCAPPKLLANVLSMILHWTWSGSMDKIDMPALCPRLRSLKLMVDTYHLAERMEVSREEIFTKGDIMFGLSLVRGIRNFSMEDVSRRGLLQAAEPGEKAFERQFRAFEEVLRVKVSRAVGVPDTPPPSSKASRTDRTQKRAAKK